MDHTQAIQDIASARAPGCRTAATGDRAGNWPYVVEGVPHEDVTRTADALQRSRYRTFPDHDRGIIWVRPIAT